MNTRQIKAIVHLGLAGICLLLGTAANAAKPAKTLVCHAPPGNPANIQIIKVGSDNAVMKHLLKHGDWIVTAPKCDTILDNDCDGLPDDSAAGDADCDDGDAGTTDSCNTDTGECVNVLTEVACPCWSQVELDAFDGLDNNNNSQALKTCTDVPNRTQTREFGGGYGNILNVRGIANGNPRCLYSDQNAGIERGPLALTTDEANACRTQIQENCLLYPPN